MAGSAENIKKSLDLSINGGESPEANDSATD